MMALSRKKAESVFHVRAHAQKVTCLDVGDTGGVLVTGGQDRKVNLWAFGSDKCFMVKNNILTEGDKVELERLGYKDNKTWDTNKHTMATIANTVDNGSGRAYVFRWMDSGYYDVIDGDRQTLNGHNGSVDCVRFTHKDDLVFSADDIGIIKQWDMNTDNQTTYNGHMKSVKTLDFHPRLPYFVSGSNDTTIRLWDMTRGNEALSKYRAHIATVNHVQFSPDGNWIASAGAEGTVLIWDVRMSAQIKEFLDSTSAVSCIQFHPSELLLAAGRTNGTVDIFDLDANKLLRKITLSTGTVKCCLFNEHGDWLFVGTDNGVTVVQWESDREVDFIESTWSNLSSMKLVNNKLICGSLDGPQAQVHSMNVEMIGRVMPVAATRHVGGGVGGPGRAVIGSGQSAVNSQKALLYTQQKELGKSRLRLLGGAGGPQAPLHQQHLHHHQGTTDSDSGSPSSNLSIEMAEDETMTAARVNNILDEDSDTIEFAYPGNRGVGVVTNNNGAFDSWRGRIADFEDHPNSLSVASSSSPSYDDPPSEPFRITQRNVEFQRGHHEFRDIESLSHQDVDRFDRHMDDFMMTSSNQLFNSGNSDLGYRSDTGGDFVKDPSTVEDFPVNNAAPPNYAPKSVTATSSAVRIGQRTKTSIGFVAQPKTQVVRPQVNTGRLTQSKRMGSLSVSDLSEAGMNSNGLKPQSGGGGGLRPSRLRVARSPVNSSGIGAATRMKNEYNSATVNKENKNVKNGGKDFKVEFIGKPPTRSRSTFDMRSVGVTSGAGNGNGPVRRDQIPVHTSRMSRAANFESNRDHYRNSNGGGGGGGESAENQEVNHIISGHERVFQALCNRHATLKMNKDVAIMQDILQAIRQIARMDTGSLVDILGAVLEKQNAMTLDMAIVVLPELYELLQSDKKFHCTRACDTLRMILTNFLPLIKENCSSWAAHSLGMDIVSEERWKKCNECRKWLLMIRSIPDNRHVSNALGQLQNLIVDL